MGSLGTLAWFGCWQGFGVFFTGIDPVWRGLAAFAAAFFVMFLFGWGLARVMGGRRPDVFGLFNEAFLRITQGDYKVQIPVSELGHRGGGPGDTFKIMAQNLNTMAGALARVEDLRRQFVADVSHEFQSPLTSILGFAEALKTGDLPDPLRQRYLEIIETEARRLSRVSANLLRLNALEDREGPPDPAPFRLDVQLRGVLVALEPQWSAKNLEIEADLTEVELIGNGELWTQVWTNLVHNAVKFTPPGGTLTVRIAAGPPLKVEVEDSGIGLAPGEADRVFERFYKAESARSRADTASGSGLGLALVHRIVTLHGARVEALSPGLGQGTTLRVSF
jgi:signal transduction histidine kinase